MLVVASHDSAAFTILELAEPDEYQPQNLQQARMPDQSPPVLNLAGEGSVLVDALMAQGKRCPTRGVRRCAVVMRRRTRPLAEPVAPQIAPSYSCVVAFPERYDRLDLFPNPSFS